MNNLLSLMRAALVVGVIAHQPAAEVPKTRREVAVLDFDYSTVADQWGEQPLALGAGLADMLVTELAKGDAYQPVERKRLDAVLQEQHLNHSAAFDPSHATALGRLLGADAVVLGSVTRFGTAKSTQGVTEATSNLYEGVGDIKLHSQEAEVGIDVRVVDCKTGAVLLTATGEGRDKRKAFTTGSGSRYDGTGSSRSFSDITQQLVGGAAGRAVVDVAADLTRRADRIVGRPVRGTIADVEPDEIVVNIGRAEGLSSGDLMVVERVYKVVHDPTSPRKVLRRLGKRVATIRVRDLDEHSAVAVLVSAEAGETLSVGQDAHAIIETSSH